MSVVVILLPFGVVGGLGNVLLFFFFFWWVGLILQNPPVNLRHRYTNRLATGVIENIEFTISGSPCLDTVAIITLLINRVEYRFIIPKTLYYAVMS